MTPSLLQACTAFQETYANALREHPEDILGLDDLDEAIHEARAQVGRAGMLVTLRRAKEVAKATSPVCLCGGKLTIKGRPDIEVHSMQGHAAIEGIALGCDRCHRTV
jgi:hypothetical protein